jgi:hypothetical protein
MVGITAGITANGAVLAGWQVRPAPHRRLVRAPLRLYRQLLGTVMAFLRWPCVQLRR